MKPASMTVASTQMPAWPTKRGIDSAAAEIRSHWSETERRHRAEMVDKRFEQLIEVIGDNVE